MNVLITGANGFLGSTVAKSLAAKGHQLYLLSKSTYNIDGIIRNGWFDYAYTEDLPNLSEKIALFAPDVVIHFGWSGGNSYADVNSTKQLTDNVQPGVALIEILGSLPKKPKFIGLGSFAEYGHHTEPLSEDVREEPISLYGLAKYTFKNYSKSLCERHNIPWTWIRPCYTYGPNDVETRLIPSLIKKFSANEPVVLDECLAVVDYLYVDDFAELLYPLVVTSATGVYNICSGNQYLLRDVISKIKELTGSTSHITYNPSLNRTAISNYTCGSNKKIKSIADIKQVDLSQGILKTINYERYNNTKG